MTSGEKLALLRIVGVTIFWLAIGSIGYAVYHALFVL